MDINQFYWYVENEDDLNETHCDELKTIIDSYPYFQIAIFLYIKLLYKFDIEGKFKEELSRLSIFINDRSALFYYIFDKEFGYFFANTGKQYLADDKTSLLLNAFFETQGGQQDEDLSFGMSLNQNVLVSNDYFAYLESSEDAPIQNSYVDIPLKEHQLIDSFIKKSEEDGGIRIALDKELMQAENSDEYHVYDDELSEEEIYENTFFSETLAKIYVKQKKYDKAYKIIKHLSLNYPKKNIYFADQLSFLEKLIINTKYKDINKEKK